MSDRWLHLPDQTLAIYNAWDTVATALLARRLTTELERNKQLPFYTTEVWPSLGAVLTMQQRGLPYDSKAKGLYRRKLRAELEETDTILREQFASTCAPPAEVMGLAMVRLCQWLGFLPASKAIRRRPAPMTKAEWTKVQRWLPSTMNPNSDHQLRPWLFGAGGLGLRPTTHTDGGSPSVDQDALNRLLQRKPANKGEAARVEAATPIIHNLMHRSRLAKIDEDYLDPEVHYDIASGHGRDSQRSEVGSPRSNDSGVPTDSGAGLDAGDSGRAGASDKAPENGSPGERVGRVYPTIKMLGTKSGRFSYADPPVHSWPPEIRHLVRPTKGYVILSADMRAIESRIFSLLTGDKIDLHIFEMNAKAPTDPQWDIHIRTACDLFMWTLDKYLEFDREKREGARNTAKSFRYGVIQYGGDPERVKTKVFCPCPRCAAKAPPSVELTPAEKKRQADRWFKTHWAAKEWRRTVSDTVRTSHRLANPFGQVRFFHAPWSAETEREAWNWPIQSSATVVLRRGMSRLHTMGAPLILEHHDALYLEVKEEEVDLWARRVRETLEHPVPEFGSFSFPTELKVGPSWGELRKMK